MMKRTRANSLSFHLFVHSPGDMRTLLPDRRLEGPIEQNIRDLWDPSSAVPVAASRVVAASAILGHVSGIISTNSAASSSAGLASSVAALEAVSSAHLKHAVELVDGAVYANLSSQDMSRKPGLAEFYMGSKEPVSLRGTSKHGHPTKHLNHPLSPVGAI